MHISFKSADKDFLSQIHPVDIFTFMSHLTQKLTEKFCVRVSVSINEKRYMAYLDDTNPLMKHIQISFQVWGRDESGLQWTKSGLWECYRAVDFCCSNSEIRIYNNFHYNLKKENK